MSGRDLVALSSAAFVSSSPGVSSSSMSTAFNDPWMSTMVLVCHSCCPGASTTSQLSRRAALNTSYTPAVVAAMA
eukprot:CAMPEP_0119104856 /NCGR_PEP_ID=MMETSP1180-20130426/2959_1 /TAXON_ID=3052 ORGANISM="Chlamydomonas cf sp, Strain CCMP681" /NCGR_SAMPLE_ID=MMETSP1180 /ASSEMBLY_ACC=CAM_ASM_000741 /LENGTH=74 /DNA_ID=CAMNT_0007089715 /DNA_START=39 /DNA_END=264 /DNA_ORIENTATION=+